MRGRISGVNVVLGFLVGLAGAVAVASCAVEESRSICVKTWRSCDLGGDHDMCEAPDECVPAEAFEADAITDCEDGQCVWDCTDGGSCPSGWSCLPVRKGVGEVLGVGC